MFTRGGVSVNSACAESKPRDGVEDFLFRKSTRRQLLEGSRHQRRTISVWRQTLASPFRSVEIRERRDERQRYARPGVPAAVLFARPDTGSSRRLTGPSVEL